MRGIAFVWQFGEVILAVALAPLFAQLEALGPA